MLAVGSNFGDFDIYDPNKLDHKLAFHNDNKLSSKIEEQNSPIVLIKFDPKGNIIVVSHMNKVVIYEVSKINMDPHNKEAIH